MSKYQLPAIIKLDWHDSDWVANSWLSPYGYVITRIGLKIIEPISITATFRGEDDMKRVVKLWNATRHLTEEDLNKLCAVLLTQRDEYA
jgi:hypothetical protein